MRIGFLSPGDPRHLSAWSGTPHFIFRELSKRFEVSYVELPSVEKALRYARAGLRRLRVDPLWSPFTSRLYAGALVPKLQQLRPDFVFALASSCQTAGIVSRFPTVHCSDATFAAMLGYYPDFSGLSDRTVRGGHTIERAVIQNSRVLLYPSDWAAQSAVRDYGADPKRLFTVPFGANLATLPDPKARPCDMDETCRLLFIGVDWNRKGGSLAVDTLRKIQQAGVKAELHVVGCVPPSDVHGPGIHVHGRLRKSIASERQLLERLFQTAAFLIVPSRQEAYGIVFCEASAYGIPSLATRTGGITTSVQDGENGFLFDPDATADPYAATIIDVWSDKERYYALRERTWQRSSSLLNWNAWGSSVADILENTFLKRP